MKTTIKIEVLKNADTLDRIIKAIALHNEGKIKVDLIQLSAFFEVQFALSNYYYPEKGAFVEIEDEGEYIRLSEDKGATFFCKLSSVGETAAKQLDAVDEKMFNVSEITSGFIVLIDLGGSYQPIFHKDDKLMFFPTMLEAQTEIIGHIDEVDEAVLNGNIDEGESVDDYRVVLAIMCGDTITCEVDGISYTMLRTDDDYKPTADFFNTIN